MREVIEALKKEMEYRIVPVEEYQARFAEAAKLA